MEHVVELNEDGTKRIVEKHKLLIPEMSFASLDLRDEATERQFLQTLRTMGVPIPDDKLMIGIPWDLAEMDKAYNEELKRKTIAQQQAKMDTYTALKAKGLPIPTDLKAEVESVLGQGEAMPGGAGGMGGGMGPPPGGGGDMGAAGGGPPTGPGGDPGGGIVMPPAPPGINAPPGGAVPGGGPPAATPNGPQRGSVPEVSNERRPGLRYNTSVDGNSEGVVSSTEELSEELVLDKYQKLVADEDGNERIVEHGPKHRTEYISKANQEKKYSIVDPDAEPLEYAELEDPDEKDSSE
jgi:hypothetical protein